jgi:GNAT superfamily N-acetyltransferase
MQHHPTAEQLPSFAYPLANQLYRANHSRMRARGHHQVLVVRGPEVLAALCLQKVAGGSWLTNLLVDRQHRCNGFATTLLRRAREELDGPIWLFCHPDLQSFYQRVGYQPCTELPPELAARLARYRLSKPLVAVVSSI